MGDSAEKQRAYYERTAEARRAYRREYYARNREKLQARMRKPVPADDPALLPIIRAKTPTPPLVRAQVLYRDDFTCRDCGKRGKPGQGQDDVQVHHIIAYSRGGEHTPDNLLTLCGKCHRKRDANKHSKAALELDAAYQDSSPKPLDKS